MLLQDFIKQYRVRQDGWNMDYGSSLQMTDSSVSQDKVSPWLEKSEADWSALNSSYSETQALDVLSPIQVVDGVRRLHQRLVLELPDGLYYGGMGTIAVGALEILPGHARSLKQAVVHSKIERFALFGGVGEIHQGLADVPGLPLGFRGVRIKQENSPAAPVEALHQQMREAEDALVNHLQNQQQSGLILVDGPLQYHRIQNKGWVVGYIKTLHTRYLPEALQVWLNRLKPGQRTPLFGIGDEILSWYMNLGQTHLTDHALMSVVRLEVVTDGTRTHREAVIKLAEYLQLLLPLLATLRHKDPRAPQNLVPVQALENALRRQMGSDQLIQRCLSHYFYKMIQNEMTDGESK